MTQEMQGPGTSQGTADPQASGLGGTPRGGAGPGYEEVAKKAPSRRASGAGSKQPTKRTSGKQKAKREAAGAAKPTAKNPGRKAAATAATATKRAVKSGATRKRVHVRH